MPDLQCPHCKNPIYDEAALLCHFCGNSLNRRSQGALGSMRAAGPRWIWITAAIAIALALLLTLMHF